MMPTWEQFKGVADRFLAMLLTYAVAKGWITSDQVQIIATIVIGLLSLGWGWWVNRNKALVQSAATVPNTVVVTGSEIANASPESNVVSMARTTVVTDDASAKANPSPNVVSSDDNRVVSRAA